MIQTLEQPLTPTATPEEEADSRSQRQEWRALVFAWKYLFGMALCQHPLTSVLVIGWAQRLAQRSVLATWWKSSPNREPNSSFREDKARSGSHGKWSAWPNWLVRQGFESTSPPDAAPRNWRSAAGHLTGSLWENARLGSQVLFNTWAVTLPGCAVMLFSWEYGWNNSFHKGYEQAIVGQATGIFGIALFIAALFYLPWGHARHAATGDWKAFYHAGRLFRLIRHNAGASLILASAYSLVALPVMALKVAPLFIGNHPQFDEMTGPEIAAWLGNYYFWCGLALFPAFIFLKWLGARCYAAALLKERRHFPKPFPLSPREEEALDQFQLLENETPPPTGWLEFALRPFSWGATAGVFALTAFVWFTFVAQMYVSEFLNYHPMLGWLNHPLVQLPWIRYIPGHLWGS